MGGQNGIASDLRRLCRELKEALTQVGRWTVQIANRSDVAEGFEALPRRWVLGRILAWLDQCRRLSQDWEKSIASAEAWGCGAGGAASGAALDWMTSCALRSRASAGLPFAVLEIDQQQKERRQKNLARRGGIEQAG